MLSLQDSLRYPIRSFDFIIPESTLPAPIIYSHLFNGHTTGEGIFFSFFFFYVWCYAQMYERSLCDARASIIHAANYKKAFCMYLWAHSHHDQRITFRSSLMSYLSSTSKSSFRHSSAATFYVCRIRMYFVSERIQRNVSFWRAGFISYLRAVDHNRLKTELNFPNNNMSNLT